MGPARSTAEKGEATLADKLDPTFVLSSSFECCEILQPLTLTLTLPIRRAHQLQEVRQRREAKADQRVLPRHYAAVLTLSRTLSLTLSPRLTLTLTLTSSLSLSLSLRPPLPPTLTPTPSRRHATSRPGLRPGRRPAEVAGGYTYCPILGGYTYCPILGGYTYCPILGGYVPIGL